MKRRTSPAAAALVYAAAVIALVMFVTWFMLFTFWATHSHQPAPSAPETLTQLPTI